jgi:hypothetical protein
LALWESRSPASAEIKWGVKSKLVVPLPNVTIWHQDVLA